MEANRDLLNAQMEYIFWLQIMGDHAQFIYAYLKADNHELSQQARNFISKFDETLHMVRGQLTQESLDKTNQITLQLISDFKNFQLQLLTLSLNGSNQVLITPSFLNEMLYELDEFQLIIYSIKNKIALTLHPIHYHLHWLNDAIIHASTIAANLDNAEKELIAQVNQFEQLFTDLFLKALMIGGYLQTKLTSFPALNRLNEQAEIALFNFKELLDQICDLRINGKVLGSLSPLLIDHMAREECYYLWKISLTVGTLQKPGCDPQRARIAL